MDKNNPVTVMPSLFASLSSSESMPLASTNELQRLIQSDLQVKGITDAYRKRLAVSKEFADQSKPFCLAISTSLLYDGKGRNLEHVAGETLMLALDYDHLPTDQLEQMFQTACHCGYSRVVYRTISGQGLRIIIGYERSQECDLTITELFNVMIRKATNFYNMLLGWEADTQAMDIGRLCGLAHDPDAYFCWESAPMTLTAVELKEAKRRIKMENRKRQGGRPKGSTSRRGKVMSTKAPTLEEALPHIKAMLESWGKTFEEHHHNDYVTGFAYCCLKYGIPEEKTAQYATLEFSQHYPPAVSVIHSVYKHREKMGVWHFFRDGDSYPVQASVRLILQWLDQHYIFYHNEVTGKYEVESRMVEGAKYLKHTAITDDCLHSLWREMDLKGIHTSVQKLRDLIESDYSQNYNPFEDYLRSLPAWDGKTDYIKEFADRITVEDRPSYYHTQEEFEAYFKKWFVSMVVAWLNPKVVNQTMLVLVGKGGIFKTTLLGAILPPCLADYFINDSTGNYLDKDMQEAHACKAHICLDEFEATYGKNLSAFKSNMTKESFSIRRPYDKFRSELMHRSSLSGTSNEQHIITDVENRRFSPWIVKKIVSPREEPINYEGLYSQAVALGQSVSFGRRREDGWVYWPTTEDLKKMRVHNRLFMVANYAEEQILRFFRIPDDKTPDRFVKMLTNAEILDKIATNPVLRQNMSNQSIGSVMSRLGFKYVHRRTGNCWLVVEKSGPEVAEYSNYDKNSLTDE